MIPQYDNNFLASFFLWCQNRYLDKGAAFQTVTTPLYYLPDTRLPANTYVTYSSPYKTWIFDSGVGGAEVLNTVSGAGFTTYPITRDSGMHVDYQNGRVILPASFGTGLALTGTFSMAEVNCYLVNEDEEQLLTQSKFYRNPRYMGAATGGVPPYVMTTPAIFINTLHMQNDAFALGGLVDSTTTMSITILAESTFQLNGLLSIFRDCKYQYIPVLNTINSPFDGFGDVKNSGFNYADVVNTYGGPGNLAYIKDIHTSKVSDRVTMNVGLFGGIVDMDVGYIRSAPISSNIFS